VVLQSSKISSDAIKAQLQFFCDRIITVDHIPITDSNSKETKPSHVQQWDENCGWTKLRLFELESYDTVLYIDADCLVVKDVSHLLHVDSAKTSKRVGLLAAAPDIFPPDKFNAGVMVIRPSKSVFDDMMSRLPRETANGDSNQFYTSYDGADTGFLNTYYSNWYSDMPSYSRLPFGYNAQRFMHHCTFQKQPKYWNEGIEDLRIIHFSSSPKPWKLNSNATNENSEIKDASELLDGNEKQLIENTRGALENMWQKSFEQSQQFYKEELKKYQTQSARKKQPHSVSTAAKPKPKANLSLHQLVQRRYKELRKEGYSTSRAMQTARDEHGMNQEYDPCKAVGQMFGLISKKPLLPFPFNKPKR
jgi:glycogenin glucosyltransferase